MAGTQIKFTVTKEAAAYLRWFAKNVLIEEDEHDAARHLMMKELEKTRRAHRGDDPALADIPPILPTESKG